STQTETLSAMNFDFANLTAEQREFVAMLETMGEVPVSGTVNADTWGARRPLAIAWLETKKKERELQSATDAAEGKKFTKDAATAAQESARAASNTAKYTLLIAIATFVAALATLASVVIPMPEGQGVMTGTN